MSRTTIQQECAECEVLTQQAFLAAIPSWIADRIVCGTLKQMPTFLNLDGRGKMKEPWESKYRELLAEVERKLTVRYHTR